MGAQAKLIVDSGWSGKGRARFGMDRQFDGTHERCILSAFSIEEVARGRSEHYSMALWLEREKIREAQGWGRGLSYSLLYD